MNSGLVFGWDHILFSVHTDCCRGAQCTPPCCLGPQPPPPLAPRSGPSLLASVSSCSNPDDPGRHPDEMLSYCLTPPGLWECPWISIVLGGVWVTLSGHFLSSFTLLPFLHFSLFSSHLPPSCSKAASCLSSRREGWHSSPCLPLEPQSCNCNSGGKWQHSYFSIYLAK